MKILVFANTFAGVSGGDRIFVELSKGWLRRGVDVEIVTNEKGKAFCLDCGIPHKNVHVWKSSFIDRFGIYIFSAYKTVNAAVRSLFHEFGEYDVVFSSSDFWPDVFPSFLARTLKCPKARWIAGCFLIAPHPFRGPWKRKRIRATLYYLSQRFSLLLIRRSAAGVLTTSAFDRPFFYNGKQLMTRSVMAVRGGVDVGLTASVPEQEIRCDAVFLGRLHSQKGLLELLDIWKAVLRDEPRRVLSLVGDGPLMKAVLRKIASERMGDNVRLLGLMRGREKFKALKASRIFVSASRLDSGNIALDEALACGVPGVVYDLPRLHYPAGVLKVPEGDQEAFAESVLRLLRNESLRRKLSAEGKRFAEIIDWDRVAERTLAFLESLVHGT